MFDISFGEFLLIMAVAMAFLGPERIPQAARALGRGVRRLRDAFAQIRDEMNADEQTAKALTEMQDTMQEIAQAVNVRRVVRELSEPLLASPLVQEPSQPKTDGRPKDVPEAQAQAQESSPEPESGTPDEEIGASASTRRIEKEFHPASGAEKSDVSPDNSP